MNMRKMIGSTLIGALVVGLVGCGPWEDPKVRFQRECKMSLSAEECQQLAYNKSQEEQARIMRDRSYGNYAQPGYGAPGYGAPGYAPGYGAPVAPTVVHSGPSAMDTAISAGVGAAAGAAIGNALSNRNNSSYNRDYDRSRDYGRRDDNIYNRPSQNSSYYNSQPKPSTTSSWTSSTTTTAPARPATQPSYNSAPKATIAAPKPSVFSKPATTSAPRASVFSKSSSSTKR